MRRAGLICALALAILAAPADAATSIFDDRASLRDPPKDARPKFRMWWGAIAGGTVDQQQLSEELQAISDAGFGGVEIGFTGSVWANDVQRSGLQSALTTAKRLGLEIDMTLGANWPFQTPNTAAGSGFSEQELMYGRTDLRGATTFSGEAPAAIGDNGQARGRLVAVTAGKVLRRGPTVSTAGTPPATPTVLDPASLVDLTDRLGPDRRTLTWDVPAGDWILFAFWQRDAEEGVVDHLRAASIGKALEFIDDQQIGAANEPLLPGVGGSFFEDSLELDASELFWTEDLPEQFQRRRGYDPRRFLPLFFVQGLHKYWVPEREPTPDFELPASAGFRYRHDFLETLTDLYVDEHLDEIQRWATTHGMRFRSQVAYGNSFDVTRSARELTRRGGLVDDESLNAGDILPFSPRSRDWRFAFDHYRTLVGGSHQGGSTHIGTELGAVFLQSLTVGLDDYRDLMDKAWAAGISRPLVHGFQSQEPGAMWPGTEHFLGLVTESWNHRHFPQWEMWKPLADRWARGALVLERGTPKTDVAIYRDGFVTTAATIYGELPEVVDGQLGDLPASLRDLVKRLVTRPRPSPFFDAEALERAGYSIQYLDPAGVRDGAAARKPTLFSTGPAYGALVVDEDWMPAATAEALDTASRAGLRVVFVGDPPARANSARDAAGEDARVQRALARVRARRTTRVVGSHAAAGGALRELAFRPTAEWSRPAPLYTQHRRVGSRDVFLVYNASDETVRVDGSFAATGAPRLLDLWTGAVTDGAVWRAERGRVVVPLALPPGGTTVLEFGARTQRRANVVSSGAADVRTSGSARVEVSGAGQTTAQVRFSDGSAQDVALPAVPGASSVTDVRLHVDEVGPEGVVAHDVPAPALGDWRTKPGLSVASGTGTYIATVDVPAALIGADRGMLLDLGRIEGVAQVAINGTPVSPELSPRHPLDATPLLRAGRNEVRIALTTTLKNKAQAVAPVTALTRPVFAAVPGSRPYGLFGPVRLVPYARATLERPLVACTSRRRVTITVPVPRGFRAQRVTVRVGSGRVRRVRVRRSRRSLRVPVSLVGRPKGRVRVRVVVSGASGRKLLTVRRYRLCAGRR